MATINHLIKLRITSKNGEPLLRSGGGILTDSWSQLSQG